MSFELNKRSLDNLVDAPRDLASLLHEAARLCPDTHRFVSYDGGRTRADQADKVASGASQTMDSDHVADDNGIHYAVDIAPQIKMPRGRWRISWDHAEYLPVIDCVFRAAHSRGIPIVWGGWWKTLVDYPHIALDRRFYPRNVPHHSTYTGRRRLGTHWETDIDTGRYLRTVHRQPWSQTTIAA